MRFASLGSGSKGNGTLVAGADTLLLVDCGFSLRETTRRLRHLGVEPEALSAILLTHEHSDHSAGVGKLSAKYQLPVYLTHGSHASGRCKGCAVSHRFNSGDAFSIGDIAVQSVAVPHDAREPCQYRFSHAGKSLGVLTDLGSATEHVVAHFSGCEALLLEFNHDLDMLLAGAYPPGLKRRVASDWGHLNNQQAADLLEQLRGPQLQQLVVAHISENNNSREKAERALSRVWSQMERVVWAEQASGFDWLTL